MKDKELFGACPFFTTQKLLTGKWTILILHILDNGEKRFNELENWGADYINYLKENEKHPVHNIM